MTNPYAQFVAPSGAPDAAPTGPDPTVNPYATFAAPAAGSAQPQQQDPASGWGPVMNTANAALMNAGPKMLAYIQSMRPGAPDDAYDQALSHYESERDAWKTQNPKTALATNIAGAAPAAAGAAMLAPAGLAGAGIAGGVLAGAPAAIENDGSAIDKATAGAKAAALGIPLALLSVPVGSLIGKGVGAAGQRLANALFNKTNPAGLTTDAADSLAGSISSQGDTPASAIARTQGMGPGAVLADSGVGTRNQLEALAAKEPKVAPLIEQNLNNRASNFTPRINDVLSQNFGPDFNAPAQMANLKANTAKVGEAYNPILNSNATVDLTPTHALIASGRVDPTIAGTAEDPITAALRKTQNQVIPTNISPSQTPISIAHRAIGTLKDQIDNAIQSGNGSMAHSLIPVRKSIIDAMPPEYNAARTAYASSKDIEDAFNQGRSVFQPRQDGQVYDPDMLQAHLQGMSDPEKQAFQMGGRKALTDMAGQARNNTQGFTTPFANDQGYNTGKAQALFGDQPTNNLLTELENQRIMRDTNNKALAGSQTARRMQAGDSIPTAPESASGHGGFMSWMPKPVIGAGVGAELGERAGHMFGYPEAGAGLGGTVGLVGGIAKSLSDRAALGAQDPSRIALAKALTSAGGQPLIDALSSRAAGAQAGEKISGPTQMLIRALANAGAGSAPSLPSPLTNR